MFVVWEIHLRLTGYDGTNGAISSGNQIFKSDINTKSHHQDNSFPSIVTLLLRCNFLPDVSVMTSGATPVSSVDSDQVSTRSQLCRLIGIFTIVLGIDNDIQLVGYSR